MAAWSAGVSTTQSWLRSRRGSRQVGQTSSSVKVWHSVQWRTPLTAACSAPASNCAPSRSCCSRWKAMRWADFTPTPGRRRSACTRFSREWLSATARAGSERELHARGQARHAGRELAHLLVRGFLGLAHGGVEGGGHQVFEHVLVVGEQAGVDGDALDVVLAGHDDLDQARAGLAGDLDVGEFVLRLLEVVLHGLGLLHQAGELSFVEHGNPCQRVIRGWP